MTTIILYFLISFLNVFLHIIRSILIIKAGKLLASGCNCVCYTFSAVVIKFISEVDLWLAIVVQMTTNFIACYIAMWFVEKVLKKKKRNEKDTIQCNS